MSEGKFSAKAAVLWSTVPTVGGNSPVMIGGVWGVCKVRNRPVSGLRYSFISYRVADVQNVAQVALEAGNSPQMIFKHYRELVRPAAAKEWFGIVPR